MKGGRGNLWKHNSLVYFPPESCLFESSLHQISCFLFLLNPKLSLLNFSIHYVEFILSWEAMKKYRSAKLPLHHNVKPFFVFLAALVALHFTVSRSLGWWAEFWTSEESRPASFSYVFFFSCLSCLACLSCLYHLSCLSCISYLFVFLRLWLSCTELLSRLKF